MRKIFKVSDQATDTYDLLTSIVVPRPIAWITTVDRDGVGNLAPHSFFNVACVRPPMVSFSSVGRKDTRRNILASGEFVVNIVSAEMLDEANASSAPFAADVDEAEVLSVALEPSESVEVPRVSGSSASLECRFHSCIKLGDSHLIIGEVVVMTVLSDIMEDGRPTIEGLRPISRLGRDEWGLPPRVVQRKRPGRP